MIFLLKKFSACMLTAMVLCLAVSMPVFAEPDVALDDQEGVSVLEGGVGETASQTVTTEVTAYIEAEPAPKTPEKPQSPTAEQSSSPATGDRSLGLTCVLLLCMVAALLFGYAALLK